MVPAQNPTGARAFWTRVRRIFVGVAGLLLIAIGAAHTVPVRGLVLRYVSATLRTSAGIELRASSLTYNLFTLSADLRDVELAAISARDTPFGSAAAIHVTLGAKALLGQLDLRRVSIASPKIVIRQRTDGTFNLPEFGDGAQGDGVALPDLQVEDLDITVDTRAASVAIHRAAASIAIASPGTMSGSVATTRGLSVVADGRTYEFDSAKTAISFDGGVLAVDDFTATHQSETLRANGRLTLDTEQPTADLKVTASIDLASWPIADMDRGALRGQVEARGRVTGALADPTIAFEASGRTLAWSSLEAATTRAAGRYEDGTVALDSFAANLGGGTVEGRGSIAVTAAGQSRVEARWSNVHAQQLLGASNELARFIAGNGSAELRWRRTGHPSSPFEVEINAATGIVAAGRPTALVLHARGEGTRWRIDVSPADASAWYFRVNADLQLNPARWQASAVNGRGLIRTSDARALIERALDFSVPISNLDPATIAGSLEVESAFGGTLGGLHATGRLQGRSLTAAGTPPVDLTSSFTFDLGQQTSKGNFRVVTPDATKWQPAADPNLEVRGAATAAGTWSGPLTSPVVNVQVEARDLGLLRSGATPVTADGGTLKATLEGPIQSLAGRGRLAFGAIHVDGRALGEAQADLALEDATLALDVSAPSLNTTIAGRVALEAPYMYSARGAMTSVELMRLATWARTPALTADELAGSFTASFEAEGNLANPTNGRNTIVVAPLDAVVFGVPLRAPAGLRALLSGDRATVDEFQLTVGAIALRGGGNMLVDTPAGEATVEVDGDLASLAPWLARLDPAQPWTADGDIKGVVRAARTPTGVAVTGSLNSTLTSVARGKQVVARDARVSLEIGDSRVRTRELTARVLDSPVEGAIDAPLSWLTAALPDGWLIDPPADERPATASLGATLDVPTILSAFAPDTSRRRAGRILIAANLSAARPELESIAGDFRLDQAEVTSGNTTLTQVQPTRLRLEAGQIMIESFHWKGPNSAFTGDGVIGLARGARSDARLRLDSGLDAVADFLTGRATGRVTGTIAIQGTSDDWIVTTDATLADATWLIPQVRMLLDGWSGHLRIDKDGRGVADLSGRVNGGPVSIKGDLLFASTSPERGVGITIAARDVLVDVPQGLHSQIGADLILRLSQQTPQLSGKVEVTANNYTEPATRILELVHSFSSTTSGLSESVLPPALAETALDIAMTVTDPVLVDNSVATVELMPDLRLRGTLDSPALSGSIAVIDDGRIRLGGHAYRLRDSQLRFAPTERLAPTLDVTGDTRIGEYKVSVHISGTPDGVETTFSSVPPLGERELQSLIVTGQTDPSTQGNEKDNFAAAAAATDILGFAGRFVGLDSVRLGAANLDLVSADVSTDQHLTVSKSLGRTFDLIFSDNLEDGTVTWVIVWKPSPNHEFRASSVEDGSRALEYRRTRLFGPGSAGAMAGERRSTSSQATRVTAVEITGTPGFSEAEIHDRLELDAGDAFDVRRWIEDRRRLESLYRDRGYHRVRIVPTRRDDRERREVALAYDIERGPETVIETTGDRLPGDAVKRMYDAWRGLPFADVARPEFERIARDELARRGYYRPDVRFDFLPESADLAKVVVQVARGPEISRLDIAWSGNRAVAATDLDALVRAERESDVWVDPQSIAWHLRQLYGSRGYLEATASVGVPRINADTAIMPITIVEGVQSRVADVQINGVEASRLADARKALNVTVGDAFAPNTPVDASRRLRAFYLARGYRSAAVTHAISRRPDATVAVAWTIKEGPLHIVKDVSVVGAESTNTGLVQDAVTLEPDAVLSQDTVDATRRNLYDIGSFRRIDFDFGESSIQPPTAGPLPVAVTIQAEEPRRFQLKYGIKFTLDRSTNGLSTTGVGGSVELQDRNLIGRALQASLGAHGEPDLQAVVLALTSPRFFGRRVRTNMFARVRYQQDELDNGIRLDERRREMTLQQRWRPVRPLEIVWGYSFSSRRFRLFENEQPIDLGGPLAGPSFAVGTGHARQPVRRQTGLVSQFQRASGHRSPRLRSRLHTVSPAAIELSKARTGHRGGQRPVRNARGLFRESTRFDHRPVFPGWRHEHRARVSRGLPVGADRVRHRPGWNGSPRY